MVYVVVACIIMPCIVMACIVMADIVMACFLYDLHRGVEVVEVPALEPLRVDDERRI